MSEICTVNDESLARAVEIIHDGGLVVIPTDTVYGVACDPRNIEAIRKVFAAKQRPKYKSLQVLLPSIESMEKLHLTLPVPLNRLAAMFMPGAFSPIAEAEDDCSLATLRHDPTTGKATQGVRIPNSAVALRILRATGPFGRCGPRCLFGGPRGRWPPPAPTVPARKAHKRCRKPRTRWEMRWICIWTGERLRDMYRPRWLQPTRTSATASRFFGRE